MNRIKLFAITISAALFSVACNEKIETELQSGTGAEITVTTDFPITKAGYEGTTTLPSEFYMDINQNAESYYNYSLVKMTKQGNSNTYTKPEDADLRWASNDRNAVSVKAMTVPYGLTSIDPENPMKISVMTDQTSAEKVKNSDLLGAKSGNGVTISGNNINLSFSHLLSKLQLNYSTGSNDYSVNSITLKKICISGGYSYANMAFDESIEKKTDEIKMYHSSSNKTAEAIFYPFTPAENVIVSIEIKKTSNYFGTSKKIECVLPLESSRSFEGGKIYKGTINITGNSYNNAVATVVDESVENNQNTDKISGEKILWVGTSIPAGNGENNYPRMVGEALGCQVINNSRPSSFVSYPLITNEEGEVDPDLNVYEIFWETFSNVNNTHSDPSKHYQSLGYCLSATPEEVYNRYYNTLFRLAENDDTYNNDPAAAAQYMVNFFQGYSYQSLIIPYINGEIDNCTTLIIDHGYNDLYNIMLECVFHNNNSGEKPVGYTWIKNLAADPSTYKDIGSLGNKSYILGLGRIIDACRAVNPNIKIIIGNYFAESSYLLETGSFDYHGTTISENRFVNNGGGKCAELAIYANQAIAKFCDILYGNVDVINVHPYTGLDSKKGIDFYDFCKDGVHPWADGNEHSNKVIASVYINELRRIFNNNQ